MTTGQLILVCALIVVSGWVGAAFARLFSRRGVVRARQFQLVDEEGNQRAVLGLSEGSYGEAMLAFYDPSGEMMRMTLGYTEGAIGIMVYDAQGQLRVTLDLDEEGVLDTPGDPGLRFWDAEGEVRAGLYLVKGAPALNLSDAAGGSRVDLGLTMIALGNESYLTFSDAEYTPRLMLGVSESGPSVDLYDAAGNPISVTEE